MVDKGRVPEREDVDEAGAVGEADPTLDIVRQMIVEAEALPEPAPPRAAPPEEPAAGTAAGRAMEGGPVSFPPGAPMYDVMPEAWDDADDDAGGADDWDDLYASGGVRGYAIVDPETGAALPVDGVDAMDDTAAPEAAAPRRVRRGLIAGALGALARGLMRAVSALARWTWRGLAALGRWIGRRVAAVAARVGVFLRRPDATRRIALGLLVIFVIAWPWKVLSLTLLIPLAAAITWASVGSDGCAELIAGWHERLKARDPDKAERIRLRAKAVSAALERGLARLPDRWTHGLYLPDFEPEGYVPEKLKVEPFEEFAAKVQAAKRGSGA